MTDAATSYEAALWVCLRIAWRNRHRTDFPWRADVRRIIDRIRAERWRTHGRSDHARA